MNSGQEKFMKFILQSVKEEKVEQAKVLLEESFAKQNDGTFDLIYLDSFIADMLELVKEDQKQQVLGIMQNFKQQMIKE
ncbi:hypothetical protein WKT02_13655 [Erysipelotrichaceae bacterium HCN-30851]